MNRKYLKYLIRSRRVLLIFLFVMFLGIGLTPFLDYSYNSRSTVFSSSVTISLILSCILAYFLPIYLFHFIHKKRSVDMYLAMPIKRSEILNTNLLFSFSMLMIFFTAPTLTALLLTSGVAYFGSYLLLLLMFAIFMAALLVVNTLWFLVANNTFDGVIMIAAYTGIPILVYALVVSYVNTIVAGSPTVNVDIGVYFSPLALGAVNVSSLLSWIQGQMDTYTGSYTLEAAQLLKYTAFLVGYMIVGLIGLKYHFISRRAERAEQLSDERFAYPLIINLYMFGVLFVLALYNVQYDDMTSFILFYLILLFIYIAATFVYKRKIYIDLKMVMRYVMATVVTIAFASIAWNTKNFRIKDMYSVENQYQTLISYYGSEYDDDGDSVSYSFNLNVTQDEMNYYAAVLDIIEDYRNELIDEYYEESDWLLSESDLYGSLTFSSYDSADIYTDGRNYYSDELVLSMEELKQINEYVVVTVDVYQNDVWEEYTLDEYLEEMEAL